MVSQKKTYHQELKRDVHGRIQVNEGSSTNKVKQRTSSGSKSFSGHGPTACTYRFRLSSRRQKSPSNTVRRRAKERFSLERESRRASSPTGPSRIRPRRKKHTEANIGARRRRVLSRESGEPQRPRERHRVRPTYKQ